MMQLDGPILAVVAHPDDEAIGCGGTLWQAAQAGAEVGVCVLSANAAARVGRPSEDELEENLALALKRLGVTRSFCGTFPNIKFNTVPHLELVQFIESAVRDLKPQLLITHHPGDLNIDHQMTAHAALAAARLPQRGGDNSYVQQVLLMETLSATDWSYPQLGQFVPQYFVEIGDEGLDAKINAIEAYPGVMRPYPHSRSEEAIRGLAMSRGAESQLDKAEAFEVAFGRVRAVAA